MSDDPKAAEEAKGGQEPRRADRARVILKAKLITRDGPVQVRLRDLSAGGAQIHSDRALAEGGDVLFVRDSIFAAARIAWVRGSDAGLEFYRKLSDEELGLR